MKIRQLLYAVATMAGISSSIPSNAEWRVATTDNFVYYSEASEGELRETVTHLEMFDKLVRALTNNSKPASPRKVMMFELRDMAELNRIAYSGGGIGGFYSNSAQGPYLVTFRDDKRDTRGTRRTEISKDIWSPEVRQHEYLHHYMYQYFNTNYPAWYTEGFAEYYGTMAFPEKGVVEIGHAPYYRLDAIRDGFWVDTDKLLSARTPGELRDFGYAVYTQGWLLTHLAASDPARGKQLQDYLARITRGEPYGQAAKAAFGDVKQLDKDLRQHAKDIQAVRLSLKQMDLGDIEIRKLSPLEGSLVTYKMRLNVGIKDSDYGLFRKRVRELRQQDPNNLMGLEIQARLAIGEKDYVDAQKNAEQMLGIDPENATAKNLLGWSLLRQLPADAQQSAYDPGRKLLAEAARSDLSDPEPMVDFYASYLLNDGLPPAEAQSALMRAHQLAPGFALTRMWVARDFEWRGMLDEAIYVIKPLAFSTFEGSESEQKRRAREVAKAVEENGRLAVTETALDMYERLMAKKEGRWKEGETDVK